MKKVSVICLVFFVSTLFLGCVPGHFLGSTITPTFTNTKTPTNTSTQTPTPTRRPTSLPRCNDQDLGDLDDPGVPPTTTRKDGPGVGFLQYDLTNFYVSQRSMHDRVVTVAIQRDFSSDEFAIMWKEFGGFPFSSYTIVIGNDLQYDADVLQFGEYGVGFESSNVIMKNEYWAHGIYHAWIGNGFRQYNDARWLMEGFTTYYGFRQSGGQYKENMRNTYSLYKEIVDSGKEVPLSSISHITPSNMDTMEHYWKGAMVAYMLDLELKNTGHHIGEVARELYLDYGVYSQGYPTDQVILDVFNEISGTDFSIFFEKYIFGIEPLPLDSKNFIWVCHDNNVYIPPIP
jgi:hypothetical protein